jgi:hypothetical protein
MAIDDPSEFITACWRYGFLYDRGEWSVNAVLIEVDQRLYCRPRP